MVSLLPSATEIIGALGIRERLVGCTHECDACPDEWGLQAALAATAALAPGSDTKLDVATLEAIAEDVPSVTLPLDAVQDAPLIEVMVAAGLQPSKSAAKRMVKQGGARVNNAKVNDQDQLVAGDDIIEGRLVLLAAGKKNKVLVRIDA